jgi:hypothetical protein
VALVFAAALASLHILGLMGGMLLGANICAMPLLTRRAIVFTPAGFAEALLPSFLRPPARIRTTDHSPVAYTEIEFFSMTVAVRTSGLRLQLRDGRQVEMDLGYCSLPADVAKATILEWISGACEVL